MPSPDLSRLRAALLRWYRRTARPFPWRNTRDPYRILVSEVMLQQTQASRVVPFYRAFLQRHPNVRSLANATRGAVLRSWQGLGYNMRALRLHATAVHVLRHRKGSFPTTTEGLMELPGIGPYTARAVAAFAFNRKVAVLDTNVRRVLRRLYPQSTDATDFQALADRLLARSAAYDWNQAIMELGARVCTPSRPACEVCPIAPDCPSAGKAARIFSKKKVAEQRYRGQPPRIYRGRVLGLLHKSPRANGLTERQISQRIFSSTESSDGRFLRQIVMSLEKDGLISVDRSTRQWKIRPIR